MHDGPGSELHVERTDAECALNGDRHYPKCFRQKRVEVPFSASLPAKLHADFEKPLVRQAEELLLVVANLGDQERSAGEPALPRKPDSGHGGVPRPVPQPSRHAFNDP